MHIVRLLIFFFFMYNVQDFLVARDLEVRSDHGRARLPRRAPLGGAKRRERKVLSGQKKRRSNDSKITDVIQLKKEEIVQNESFKQREILDEVESTEILDEIIEKEEKQQLVEAKKEGRIVKTARKKKKIVETLQEQSISLNFEKIKLSSFINYIAGLRKLNMIPDKATEGIEVSVAIREPLTVDGAWQVFLTLLEMHGFSIVEIGPEGNKANVHKVIPRAGKVIEPLPSYIGVPLDDLPNSDITIRYVGFLQNIAVTEVANLLASMLGADSRLIAQSNINGFIITDKALNIKSGMKVIQDLDQSGLQETVVVRRLQKANALEVKFLMERLINSPETSPLARLLGKKTEGSVEYFSSSTKIIAEERSNSLILLGNHKSIKVIEDFIDRYFEKEERFTKSPLKVFTFKYAEAAQIRDLLTEVVNSSGDSAAAKHGGVLGGVKYFKNMNFQVDERGNQLVISCADPRDWKILKPTLKALDTAQPSVVLETLIVSVNADDQKSLGGQIRPKNFDSLGKSIGFQSAGIQGIIPEVDSSGNNMSLFGNLLGAISGLGRGSTVLSFGGNQPGNIWAVFRALKKETNASIISQPFITVANRVKATIKAGDTRRIQKERAVSDGGSQGDAASYTDQDALTHIEYTPHINLDGIINLQVNATIAEFSGNEGKLEKKLTTNVSVASGQVLVLGGFIKTILNQSEGGTPFLSKIPIFGWLFKNKDRNLAKQYIFIFVCPTIIKPRQKPGADLYTKMKLHKARDSVESAVDNRRRKDPIHNWFFNPNGETYAHKVVDFATARYQPTLVDIKNDPEYRFQTEYNEQKYGPDHNQLDIREEELPPKEEVKDTSYVLSRAALEKKKNRDREFDTDRERMKKFFDVDVESGMSSLSEEDDELESVYAESEEEDDYTDSYDETYGNEEESDDDLAIDDENLDQYEMPRSKKKENNFDDESEMYRKESVRIQVKKHPIGLKEISPQSKKNFKKISMPPDVIPYSREDEEPMIDSRNRLKDILSMSERAPLQKRSRGLA